MISIAEKKDVPQLKKLWKEAFGEDVSAEMFYDGIFSQKASGRIKILVERKKDIGIVSMLHYIPCCYESNNRKYNGAYLYALATAQQYRGQKIMGALIQYAIDMAESMEMDFLYLIPATDSLYEYYQRFGFCETVHAMCIPEISIDRVRKRQADLAGLWELIRKKWKDSNMTIFFEEEIHKYTLKELMTENDFAGYELMMEEKTIGFLAGRKNDVLLYGTDMDSFMIHEDTRLKKNGSILKLKDGIQIGLVSGWIPY